MAELWWLWAIISSILISITVYANQIFKMPSSLMMTYRGFIQSLILLPFFPLFEMPSSPWFWGLGMLQGLMIGYSDKKYFLAARLFGGEIVGTIKPYVIAGVFVLWLVIKPAQLFELIKEPGRFALICLCLSGVIYSLTSVCRAEVSKKALLVLLPSLILSALIDANNKYLTVLGSSAGLPAAIFYYCWITALFAGLPNVIKFVRRHSWRRAGAPKYIAGGILVIFCSVMGNLFKNTAMYYAYNPAFVSAIMGLAPVWIIAWNNCYYHFCCAEQYPRCNFRAVGILLLSVTVLILI